MSRSPGSSLPPLDPYVEIDQNIPILPPHWGTGPNIVVSGRDHGDLMHNGTFVANGYDYSMQNGATGNMVNGRMSPVRRRSANSGLVNSCRLVPRGFNEEEALSAPAIINSSGNSSSSSDSSAVDSDGASPPPPLTSKGKHVCPRCARRFAEKKLFQQHKDRCLS